MSLEISSFLLRDRGLIGEIRYTLETYNKKSRGMIERGELNPGAKYKTQNPMEGFRSNLPGRKFHLPPDPNAPLPRLTPRTVRGYLDVDTYAQTPYSGL